MDVLEKVMDSLHEFEKKLLIVLEQSLSVEKAVELTGLNQIEVMRAAQWLNNKGLILIKEKTSKKIVLTKRGEETVEKGLPELRLLELLENKGRQEFNNIMKNAELDKNEFNKALGFTRKEGLISILNNELEITSLGREFLEKEHKKTKILKSLKNNEKVKDSSEVRELSERGLVVIEDKTDREFITTPKGIQLLKKGIDMERVMLERSTAKTIKSREWEGKDYRRYNVNEKVPKKNFGKLHPYAEFIDKIRDTFVSIGFKEMTGPYVENNFTNCDALFMPQDHPARGIHDIFYIKEPAKNNLKDYKKYIKKVKKAHESGVKGSTGWKVEFDTEFTRMHVLRSQTTSASVRMLMNPMLEIPGKYFVIDRNVRPDVVDRTHGAEFLQMEGIVLGEDLNLRSLFDLLRMFAEDIAKVKKYKLMPDYYPYTEPSVSLHIYANNKWMELGGAGIFRKEVTEPLGVKVPVIAWGLGFDRAFMSERKIKDIRQLFSTDINWLRNSEVTP